MTGGGEADQSGGGFSADHGTRNRNRNNNSRSSRRGDSDTAGDNSCVPPELTEYRYRVGVAKPGESFERTTEEIGNYLAEHVKGGGPFRQALINGKMPRSSAGSKPKRPAEPMPGPRWKSRPRRAGGLRGTDGGVQDRRRHLRNDDTGNRQATCPDANRGATCCVLHHLGNSARQR